MSSKGQKVLREFVNRVTQWMTEQGIPVPNPDLYKKWCDSGLIAGAGSYREWLQEQGIRSDGTPQVPLIGTVISALENPHDERRKIITRCHLTHKSAIWAKICVKNAVTLPIGLQSWTHTFANEPQECPLSAQKGLGVAFIALCL